MRLPEQHSARMLRHSRGKIAVSYIQLIEAAALPTSRWLTFWDLEDQSQISLEIAEPADAYQIGSIFILDRDARVERLALKPVAPSDLPPSIETLIPLPGTKLPEARMVTERSVSIRETRNGISHSREGYLRVVS